MDEIIANLGCCHIPKQKSEKLSLVMEKCFGGFLNKRRCETGIEHEYLKFNENDVIDDLINKCKFSDSELRTSRPAISAAYAKFLETYRKAKKDTKCIEALYQYFQEREQNRKRASAATKIQTFFRGYSLRKLLQKQKTSSVIPEMTGTPKDSPVDEEQFLMREMAARRIQRFLRSRYKVKHAPFEGNSVSRNRQICHE
uniref:Uncharacterized protein n=1 Tax=Glossina brevipalpis TaxID=37001 RepID=A0A1A9WAR6_9MUSC